MPQLVTALDTSARNKGAHGEAESNVLPSNADQNADQASALLTSFKRIKAAYNRDPNPSYELRMERLGKLLALLRDNQQRLAQAISEDFSCRSQHETRIAEIFVLVTSITYIRKNLKSWMKPRNRHVSLALKPASAKVQYQPLGVVGIIAPVELSGVARPRSAGRGMAAGNRVMLKPSDFTPQTSELIAAAVGELFAPGGGTVITGGPQSVQAFSGLPFDHLLFTGSTAWAAGDARGRGESHAGDAGARRQVADASSTPMPTRAGGRAHPGGQAGSTPGRPASRPITCCCPRGKRGRIRRPRRATISTSIPTSRTTASTPRRDRAALCATPAPYSDEARARGARRSRSTLPRDPAADARKIPPTLLLDAGDELA